MITSTSDSRAAMLIHSTSQVQHHADLFLIGQRALLSVILDLILCYFLVDILRDLAEFCARLPIECRSFGGRPFQDENQPPFSLRQTPSHALSIATAPNHIVQYITK